MYSLMYDQKSRLVQLLAFAEDPRSGSRRFHLCLRCAGDFIWIDAGTAKGFTSEERRHDR